MARHLYILGIGGTLMGSLALLARQAGYRVSGSDQALYPPMSDQLAAADIELYEGFDAAHLDPAPDLILVGNAGLPRGNPAVEAVLNSGLPYTSGAEWLGREILQGRWVLAVSGTHGKTTTASMLAWILDQADLDPGFMIGGVPANFGLSARMGSSPFFVVEADEYDTSYFDRRAKFVHYRPRTLLINNLEYDHADIYPDLAAIQYQFHLLLRSVPGQGLIVAPDQDDAVQQVLQQGCWTPVSRIQTNPRRQRRQAAQDASGDSWQAALQASDGTRFDVVLNGVVQGQVQWDVLGLHNVQNALGALAAARHAGVDVKQGIAALAGFRGVARRMELLHDADFLRVYDDFAHHPTAIRSTLQGLRAAVGSEDIIAVIEPRSHTMSLGTLQDDLRNCTSAADQVIWYRGDNIKWDLGALAQKSLVPATVEDNLDRLLQRLLELRSDSGRQHLVFMSNGGFGGIQRRFVAALNSTGN